MDQAWLLLKRENFAFAEKHGFLPAVPKHRTDEGFDKGGYSSVYEEEELRDVNEALERVGVVPAGLTGEYAPFAPGMFRQSAHSISDMAPEHRLPHQYLPYKTEKERGIGMPSSFYVSDPDSGESTMGRPYRGPTLQDLIDARSERA
jgi:hypothetical protein|tara:strand:+ start:2417 stop:2857 length:441 start_codon:yes stop_codon:yes gene_type:complete